MGEQADELRRETGTKRLEIQDGRGLCCEARLFGNLTEMELRIFLGEF